MSNDDEHKLLLDFVAAVQNILLCLAVNDGDSLANAANDAQALLDRTPKENQ